MTQMMTDNFEVRIIATAEDQPTLELKALSAAVMGWDDTESDEEEEEEFLVADESEDEEEEEGVEGTLTLTLDMTAEAFAEYRHIRDSDINYTLTTTIIYKDPAGVPVFHHEYDCYDGMYLSHVSGHKEDNNPLRLELQGDYEDCMQFAVIKEATVQQ